MENCEKCIYVQRSVLSLLKFSVLLSVYKKENPEYLQQALESIENQTLHPDEIVIVKDGVLTKKLDACIETFKQSSQSDVKIIAFTENRGLGLALRDGVLACKYEYIARMDTDDIAVNTRFEKQIKYLDQNPDIALLGSWVKEFSKNVDHPDTLTQLPCNDAEIRKFAKKRNPFRHMTVVFKKSAVIDSGNYRDFLWFEDYDLWVRMLQKGYKAANLAEYLVNVRADDEMFARRGGWKYLKQDIRFQAELYKSGFVNAGRLITNILIRSVMRLVPNWVRVLLYKNILRKNGENSAESFCNSTCL